MSWALGQPSGQVPGRGGDLSKGHRIALEEGKEIDGQGGQGLEKALELKQAASWVLLTERSQMDQNTGLDGRRCIKFKEVVLKQRSSPCGQEACRGDKGQMTECMKV